MKTMNGLLAFAIAVALLAGPAQTPAAAMDKSKLPPQGPADKIKPPPDLDITSTTVDPPNPRIGQHVKITFRVTNIGGSPMGSTHFQIYGPYNPVTGPQTTNLQDLLAAHTINGAAPAGGFAVPALGPGKYADLAISGILDPKKMNIPTGTYEVLMDLNVSNKPPEGSQNNNFKGTQFDVRPALALKQVPDLHMKEVSIIPPRPVSRVRPARQ
jgi:hypothetical protein